MIDTYGYKGGLKELGESLNASGVLSDQYATKIFNLALVVYGEGYYKGIEDFKKEKDQGD